MRLGTRPRWLGWTGVMAGGLLLALPAAGEQGARPAGAEECERCHPKGPGGPAAGTGKESAAGYVRSERAYVVPDVTLVDDADREVRLHDVLAADEAVMLNFIFTTCSAICPVMTRIFAQVAQEMGREAGRVRLISISIDPEHDTPARLRAYAERFGAGPRWTFLTGRVEDIVAVERAFEAFRGDKMNHAPLTLLRPAPGRPWVRLDGFASSAQLAREYEKVAPR